MAEIPSKSIFERLERFFALVTVALLWVLLQDEKSECREARADAAGARKEAADARAESVVLRHELQYRTASHSVYDSASIDREVSPTGNYSQ